MTQTEKILNKAQKMWWSNLNKLEALPDPHDLGYKDPYSAFGGYQEFRKLIKTRTNLAFADGVFHALASVSTDENKEKFQHKFINGDGI